MLDATLKVKKRLLSEKSKLKVKQPLLREKSKGCKVLQCKIPKSKNKTYVSIYNKAYRIITNKYMSIYNKIVPDPGTCSTKGFQKRRSAARQHFHLLPVDKQEALISEWASSAELTDDVRSFMKAYMVRLRKRKST